MWQKYLGHLVAGGGALIGCIELYNILETIATCSFSMNESEAKTLSFWLSLILAFSLRGPTLWGLYSKNNCFFDSERRSGYLRINPPKKNAVYFLELFFDLIAALSAGGLSLYAAVNFFSDVFGSTSNNWGFYLLSFFLSCFSTVTVFGINRKYALSNNFFFKENYLLKKSRDFSTKQYISVISMCFLLLIAGINDGFEIAYSAAVTIFDFLRHSEAKSLICPDNLFNFKESIDILILISLSIFALLTAFKSMLLGFIHLNDFLEFHHNLLNSWKNFFHSGACSLGAILAAALNNLGGIAALSILPLTWEVKCAVSLGIFILNGLGTAPIFGSYWREAVGNIIEKIKFLWAKSGAFFSSDIYEENGLKRPSLEAI
mgnify:CR=1 FL=1